MYIPAAFKEERVEVLVGVMRGNSFAVLVSGGGEGDGGGMVGTHLPVVVKTEGGVVRLEMHVARANGHWQAFEGEEGAEVLVIFNGPHAYVSPAWYADKTTVPTWNYVAVHAYGRARVMSGERLTRHLEELVAENEGANGTAWSVGQTPAKVREGLEKAIVGVEVVVERLEGKVKMSQNRAAADRAGAIEGLRAKGGEGNGVVAEWMEKRGG